MSHTVYDLFKDCSEEAKGNLAVFATELAKSGKSNELISYLVWVMAKAFDVPIIDQFRRIITEESDDEDTQTVVVRRKGSIGHVEISGRLNPSLSIIHENRDLD